MSTNPAPVIRKPTQLNAHDVHLGVVDCDRYSELSRESGLSPTRGVVEALWLSGWAVRE